METSTRLSNFSETEIEEYQELSWLAVTSTVVGIAAVISLSHPALSLIGLTAAACGLIALRNIAARGGMLRGRNLAIIGLGLGTLFATWSISQSLYWRYAMYTQAREYAEGWFDLLESGDHYSAHQTSLPHYERLGRSVNLPRAYEMGAELKEELKTFLEEDAVKALVNKDGKFVPKFSGNLEQWYQKTDLYVVLRYHILNPDSNELAMDTRMLLKRYVTKATGKVVWQVVNVLEDKPDEA